MKDSEEVTVVTAEDFGKNPSLYLSKKPLRIVFTDSKLTITVMNLAEPRPRSKIS